MNPDYSFILPGLMVAIIMLVAGAALLLWREASRRDLELRIEAVTTGTETRPTPSGWSQFGPIVNLLQSIGQSLRSRSFLYSPDDVAALEGMLLASGFNARRLLPVVLGAKGVLFVLIPLLAVAYTTLAGKPMTTRVLAFVIGLPVGLLVPDWILGWLRRPYVKALQRGVADALDLLVVCAEAGMGLESGIEQVAREMRDSNQAIAAALTRLLDELKVLPDRRTALLNFGKRSGVEGLRKTATILAQSLEYGTPLGQALRATASEMRRERAVRFEEKATRLPALLVFPLIFFILPSLFIVIGGSQMLRLAGLMGSLSGLHK